VVRRAKSDCLDLDLQEFSLEGGVMSGETNDNSKIGEFNFKLDLVKMEMDTVRDGANNYGQVQFTVKGWAITLFSALSAFAFERNEPRIFWVSAGVTILFFIVDLIFKGIQKVYLDRALEIEKALQKLPYGNGEGFTKLGGLPGIETKFESLKKVSYRKRVTDTLRRSVETPQLTLFYVAMLAANLFLAVVFQTK
jgi:hypothetical protein